MVCMFRLSVSVFIFVEFITLVKFTVLKVTIFPSIYIHESY